MPQAIQRFVAPASMEAIQKARIVILTTALQQQMQSLDEIKKAYPDTDFIEEQQAAIWNALEQVR